MRKAVSRRFSFSRQRHCLRTTLVSGLPELPEISRRRVRAASRTPSMQSFIVDRVRIEPRSGIRPGNIAVDGEIVSIRQPLEYRLIRDGLKVVVGNNQEPAVP